MEEKITSTVQENEDLKTEAENELIKEKYKKELKKQAKRERKQKGRQIALKILSTISYLAITVVALMFEAWAIVDSIDILTMEDPGMSGLAFIILIPVLIIVPIASFILYLIPFIMSLVGFIKAFKKSSKKTRITGKLWFGALTILTVASEIALIIASVGMVIGIQFGQ